MLKWIPIDKYIPPEKLDILLHIRSNICDSLNRISEGYFKITSTHPDGIYFEKDYEGSVTIGILEEHVSHWTLIPNKP